MTHETDEKAMAAKSVPALRRAVDVLDLVAGSGRRMTAADIARTLGLPKSTAHGLFAAMVELDLLTRGSDGVFRPGPHPMRWTSGFLSQLDVVSIFQEHFAATAAMRRYTATLTVLDGAEVVYIGCHHAERPLGFTFRIGMRLPAPFTATGKIQLAHLPAARLDALFAAGFPPPLTPRSLRDLAALRDELDVTRRRGFSIDDGEVREGMTCIGAVLHDHTGKVAAGIAISLITGEADAATIDRLGKDMRETARALSLRLGAA